MTQRPREVHCPCGASAQLIDDHIKGAEQTADFRDTHDCSLRDPADAEWITPEVAALVLARASDGSAPIPYEQVLAGLDEHDLLEDA